MKDGTTRSYLLTRLATAAVLLFFFLVTFPSIYFLIQLVALVPVAAMLVSAFQNNTLATFGVAHFFFYVFLDSIIACLLAWGVHSIQRPALRRAVFGGLVAVLALPAFFKPYGIGGHGNGEKWSWRQTFVGFKPNIK